MSSLRIEPEVLALRQGLSAIDNNRRAGDIGRIIGCKKERGIGDVARRAKAAQRNGLFHRLDEGCERAFSSFGQDVAGLDAIDGDAIACKLQRRRLDETVDASLARRIMPMAGARHTRAGNREVKIMRPCLLPSSRKCGARREIDAFEIDRHHAVPFLGLDILDQGPGIDAGILHKDVEPAVGRDSCVHGPLGIGFL